ncbi:hypothetical protein HDV03_004338 [Kappamyces sp. JEL0829]|nr:hypothetical protein HDV03_004338 [Kappamyces sp. JEL0829]
MNHLTVDATTTPTTPSIPSIPSIPTTPSIPAIPSIPTTPTTASAVQDTNLMPPPSQRLAVPGQAKPIDQFPMLGGPQRASERSTGLPRKKPLAPGHSPLDWARLKQSTNVAGVDRIGRYTLEELAQHKSKSDLWMAYQGKIYNCTSYLAFHPGGVGQLLRGAGKDATELIAKIHPWVNIDMMLDQCLVGYLVKEH